MSITALMHWASANSPGSYIGAAVAGLFVLLLLRAPIRALKRWDLADVITVVVALAATAYAGTGTWKYLGDAMHYSVDLKAFLVAVLEGAQIAEALRARKNIKESGTAGVDGIGLWVLTGISATLSTSVASNVREALGRAIIPAVGAWLWERALAPQRRAARARKARSLIRWRVTGERIAVWLRLADAIDTDVSTVEAGRRVSRYLRATDRATRSWRRPWSPEARADRARMRLTTHALMHSDPTEVHEQLADSAFNDALKRLGIDSSQTPQNRPVLNVLSSFTRPFPPQDKPFSAPVKTLPSPPPENPVQQARELQRQGLSYQEIGDRLGKSKTWAYNAVNGRAPASVNGHGG